MKKTFKTVDGTGNEIELVLLKPSPKIQVKAQIEFNKMWATAERGGSPLRRNVDTIAERQGLWGAEQLTKLNEIEEKILVLERKLRGGASNFDSVEQAKSVALEIRVLRNDRGDLLRMKNSVDQYTAEALAETTRMQYIVSQCVVDDLTGKPFFESYDDYLGRQEEKCALDGLTAYLEVLYEDLPTDETTYEVGWLKKYKFMDGEGRLIDSNGRWISDEGKLINKDYKYVNECNELVDRDGVRVDESGNYLIEYVEFPQPDKTVESNKETHTDIVNEVDKVVESTDVVGEANGV